MFFVLANYTFSLLLVTNWYTVYVKCEKEKFVIFAYATLIYFIQ